MELFNDKLMRLGSCETEKLSALGTSYIPPEEEGFPPLCSGSLRNE